MEHVVCVLFQSPVWFSGICSIPQGLKLIHSDVETGSLKFGWNEIECEQRNGALLGYELKLFYSDKICTERVTASVTAYTVVPKSKPQNSMPSAISVAAINQVGVGDYSLPLKINPVG